MAIVTSGTVSTTVFNTRKVIDRAFGRCKLAPQQISGEYIEIANDFLYLFLSALSNKGIPTWAIQKIILPLYAAEQSVPCPEGTIDILNANLRFIQQIQLGQGQTYSSSEGVAANAFDNDLTTACNQVTPGGFLQVGYSSPSIPVVFGVMPAATGTWDISIQTSEDGDDWDTVWENASFDAVDGEWLWVDIEGIPPTGVNFVQLQAGASTTLEITEFVTGAMPNEIPFAKINRDDYANLPNKFFTGQPVEFWYDKQFDQPIMTLWPSPAAQFTYAQIVAYVKQHIQDVGSMTQSLAIPQRWFLATLYALAEHLAEEIPEVDWSDPRVQLIPARAKELLGDAWASESDGSPIKIVPRISSYTR